VQRAYVHNNRNNPITKKTTASGSLFFFLKNWASAFLFVFCFCLLDAASHVALCRDGGGNFFFSTGPHSSHKARGGT